MIVQDLVTIDSLCTFHVMHIYWCKPLHNIEGRQTNYKMIKINQALQLYKGITLSIIETAYTLKYMPYTLS